MAIRLSLPPLSTSAVHVWTLALSDLKRTLPKAPELLSSDEIERWQRFRFDEHKQRFAITRQALRVLLSSYTGTAPADTTLMFSPEGKPRLAKPASDIQFNVTHSADFAMVAIGREHALGIDLEYERQDVEINELANRFFSNYEQGTLRATPVALKRRVFFQIWTAKEALIKATGLGLSLPLNSFDVGGDPVHGYRLIATRPPFQAAEPWHLQNIPAPEEYSAALATNGKSHVLQMLEWSARPCAFDLHGRPGT